MIIKKFQETVEQFPGKMAICAGKQTITYSELNAYANQVANAVITGDKKQADNSQSQRISLLFEHGADMVVGVIGVLKANKAYVPLDITYPEQRLLYMLDHSDSGLLLTNSKNLSLAQRLVRQSQRNPGILNIDNIITGNEYPGVDIDREVLADQPAYILYTSGSTGRPKGVVQTNQSVLYYTRNWVQRFTITKADRMTLFSAFSHDGSVQDIFAALLTGACLYPFYIKTNAETNELYSLLMKEKISIWHSVPTLFRYFAGTLTPRDCFYDVRWVLLGGEPLREHDLELYKTYFPNAHLANVYGQTESSVSTICVISPGNTLADLSLGEPLDETEILLVDEDGELVEDMGTGEIVVACDHIARGYWQDQENSQKVFLYNDELGRLYRTGDWGRLTARGGIKMMGRKDFQVKIRGFRVEIGEIETRLLQHESVKEAVTTVKTGENGCDYLCAYIVPDAPVLPSQLRKHLSAQLPDYMVPRYFISLEEMPITPNGKIDRKALPAPETFNKFELEYEPPGNEIEQKIAEIWQDVLKIQKVGINDNFIERGGHSLLVISIIGKIHRDLDVKLQMKDVFEHPTVKELSRLVLACKQEKFFSIEPVEKREYYPVSSAQLRLFILSRLDGNGTAYNLMSFPVLEGKIDKNRLENTFKRLLERHESLRTSFEMKAEKPVQKIYEQVDFKVEYYELEKMNMEHGAEEEFRRQLAKIIMSFERPFDLSGAPLLRVGMVPINDKKNQLLLDMHHIITDGISQAILTREFTLLYSGEELSPLRLQYKDFSRWQNSSLQKEIVKQQEAYWLEEFNDELPVLKLPTDYPRPLVQSFEGNLVSFAVNSQETKILKDMAKENHMTLHMCLLAILNILLSKLSGQEDIIIGTPVATRRHAHLARVIGMLVNTLAIRNFPSTDKTGKIFLKEVKQRTLKAYENQDYPFEELVEKLAVTRDTSRNPLFDVMLSFLDQSDFSSKISERHENNTVKYVHRKSKARFDMAFSIFDRGELISVNLEYWTKLFTPSTIERFIRYFKNIVRFLPGNNETKLADIEIVSAEEKKEILRRYEGVRQEIDPGPRQTIHGLFEEKAEAVPGKLALVFKDHHLTYNELNKRANRLAEILRKKGVYRELNLHLVALLMERSLEMIVALLAIMKAGCAYLPIDPGYPRERVLSMLSDSGVSFILTKGDLLDRFSITGLKNIKGLDWKPEMTPGCAQIDNLDQLPYPDRTLVDYHKYHQHIGIAMAKHTVLLQATRGCPYNCAFCHKIWPKTHVARSAENIFREIQQCRDAGVKRFVFIDDIFNLDKKNSARLLEKIIRNRLDLQLFFPNGLRGDILTKDFIDLMIEAGTINMDLALESACPRIQKLIKKNLHLDRFRENLLYIAKKYPHVVLEIEMMIGFPTETPEEALMTLDFLKSVQWVHFPNLNILKIYPNTDMYHLAIENGIDKKLIERSTDLGFHHLPETLPFSKDFVKEFQARFLNEYFLSGERLLKVLPDQSKYFTRDEIIQKYDSYLPMEIKSIEDLLQPFEISMDELGPVRFLPTDYMSAPNFNKKMKRYFPAREKDEDAFSILLIDLSQLFSSPGGNILYDVNDEPLGLMALMSYLDERFGSRIRGKVLKSRIDFDSFIQLKRIITQNKPHLIGIRTLSLYKEFFHTAVLKIRQWNTDVPVIAGGPYATSDYLLMLQDRNVDLAVLGEGELTLARLVEKMMENENRLPGQEVLKTIHGIAFAGYQLDKKDKTGTLPKEKNRDIILLDEISGELGKYPVENLEHITQPHDLLYIIYTSGSTGKPKGVMLEHRNLVNLLKYQYQYTNIDFSRVLQFTTISFDVSFQEIFSTLLAGGELTLVSKETINDIPALFQVIKKEKLKTLFLPASFLKFVSNERDYMKQMPKGLSHIVTAGEQAIINDTFKRYLRENGVYFHNHYGPSETHVVTTYTRTPGEAIPKLPPIGRPVQNTWIYILDKGQHLQPPGLTGELYIGGKSVGRGYLNRPELTAEKFLSGSYRFYRSYRSYRSYILYRTGDLARWLKDGNIEFLGRMDSQVKVRGFRVEPGEIESLLLNHPGIKECIVLTGEDKKGTKYLCAYIAGMKEFAPSALREYLAEKLPDYMVPAYFVQIDKIPLTTNRKIDYRALPAPRLEAGEGYTAPGNPVEEKLVEIWSEVLGLEKKVIGIDRNFFEMGGHSLNATIMTAKVHKVLNVNLPLTEVFKTPWIRGLANYITKKIKNLPDAGYLSIKPTEKKDYYELSSAQKRLYILQQMDLASGAYNLPQVITLKEIEKNKLESTLKRLVARHESLRTSFIIVGNEPVQKVHEPDEIKFEIEYYDASQVEIKVDDIEGTRGLAPLFEESHLSSVICHLSSEFIRPFDLSSAPLMRSGLIKFPGGDYTWIVDMHHIITDGVSIVALIKDFMDIYKGEELPELHIHYKDYAGWQNRQKKRGYLKNQEQYWLKQFEGEIPILDLPTDFSRPLVQDFEGNSLAFKVQPRDTEKLKALALTEGSSLFMVLVTLVNILLSKLGSQEDIIVGSPIAGRKHADLERIIGMFVNTLALRNWPSGEKHFKAFLREVKENTLAAFENQDYQFEDLVENVTVNRDISRNPLFDVMFAMQNINIPEWDRVITTSPGNLKLKSSLHRYKISKFDLTFYCKEPGNEEKNLNFVVEYSSKLFKQETILRFTGYFKQIIRVVTVAPDTRICDIEIISPQEKQRILADFNRTEKEYPKDTTIHRMFAEQVERTPHHISLVGVGTRFIASDSQKQPIHVTYRELNQKSNQLAYGLRQKGVGTDTIVAITAERSIEMMIGIFGILKAGGAYLPIDPEYPQHRIDYMLRDSNARLLIKKSEIRNSKFETNPNDPNSNDQNKRAVVTVLDFEHLNFEFVSDFDIRISDLNASNLAYIIYTSGSTGQPKGVMVQHSSVLNRVNWMQCAYPIGPGDVILQKTNISFDVSVWELFWWNFAGASLYLPGPGQEKDPGAVTAAVEQYQVTTLHFVPSMLSVFLEYLEALPTIEINKLTSLKRVFSSGEALNGLHVEKFYRLFTTARLINLYGPTEATVDVSYFNCSKCDALKDIPIGKPIDNIQLLVIDRYFHLQPIGSAGELCISGVGLARGYLNQPELTAQKFLYRTDRIYRSYRSYKSYILYKTGDLARWLEDGNIEFLGRIDHQVKIRGYRIELGEIENQLLKHDKIKEAVVVMHCRNTQTSTLLEQEDKYLCAYILAKPKAQSTAELRDFLAKNLPGYMIPSYFVLLDKIPLAPTGKIDTKAIAAIDIPDLLTQSQHTTPTNEIERGLVDMWKDLLGVKHAGVNDNFFVLGGHSLKAIQLVSMIHKRFNVRLSLTEVFKNPYPRALAGYIKEAVTEKFASIKPVEKKEYYALSSAQKRLYVLQQMELAGTAYNMPQTILLSEKPDIEKLEKTIMQLIERHESLRTSFHLLDNQPMQKIQEHVEVKVEVKNLEGTRGLVPLPIEVATSTINEFIRFFDLSRAPLLRLGLIKTGGKKYILIVDMHHIIMDGISHMILEKDFMALYHEEIQNLSPLRIQYKDFSHWQNQAKQGEMIKQQELYWFKQFEDGVPVLNLPSDYPRPAIQSFEGEILYFEIPGDYTSGLRTVASGEKVTLYMVLLAVTSIFLSKLSSQEDIIIGTPVAGRRHIDLDQVIGMFVNTLAVRNYPTGEKTFREFLAEVKQRTLEAFDHQDYQFEDLVNKLPFINRDAGRNPLFDVMLSLENLRDINITKKIDTNPKTNTEDEWAGEKLVESGQERYPYKSKIAKFDLTLTAVESKNKIFCTFDYCTSLFKKETIERFIGYLKKIISQVIKNARIKLSNIAIISEEEIKYILEKFNATDTAYPRDKTIQELFAGQVEKTPDNIAAAGPLQIKYRTYMTYMTYITYRELNKKSNQLAQRLQEKGVRADTIVGIMMERSTAMIVGILGILKAGGAYLPIDPDYPQDRIDFMLKDSNADILLTNKDITPSLSTLTSTCQVSPANLAYIIYTSGTTGRPKGVMVEHPSVVNVVTEYGRACHLGPGVHLVQMYDYTFDASAAQVFGTLVHGAVLHVIPKDLVLDIDRLREYIKTHRTHIIDFVPSLLNQLLAEREKLESLEIVISGAEKLNDVVKEKILSKGYRLYNYYGPTETTVDALVSCCTPEDPVTLGRPIGNVRCYILDKNKSLLPVGVPGELYIAGAGLARGYLNQPELTARKFQLPDESGYHRSYRSYKSYILYQTGDLAMWLSNGNIEFLGRVDFQVKIRGFRVELGEIEHQLLTHDEITAAVVMARKGNSLCAYVVTSNENINIPELREYLSRYLPSYMVPGFFVRLEKLPLYPNGKINYKALPEPMLEKCDPGIPDAPAASIEKKLVDIWSQVLGIKEIGINDNFFEMGGDSIKAIQVTAKAKEQGLHLKINDLFLHPVIKELAQCAKRSQSKRKIPQDIVTGEVPLTPIQRWFFQAGFTDKHHFNHAVMLHRAEGFDEEILQKVLIKLMEHHDALRMVYESQSSRVSQTCRGTDAKLFDFEVFDFKEPHPDAGIEKEIPKQANRLQAAIDLKNGPLVKLGLFKISHGDHLLIIIHHLVMDGISWRILLEDFYTGYTQLDQGKEIQFPVKTDSFQYWSQKLCEYAAGEAGKTSKLLYRELDYWKDLENTKIETLPRDELIDREKRKQKYIRRVQANWNKAETEDLLKQVNRAYNTEINDILLTALGMAVKEWANVQNLLINLEGHGREPIFEDIDISRTVGWFTIQYPVLLDMNKWQDLSYAIKSAKETLRRVPNKGFGYGVLKYLAPRDKKQGCRFNLEPQINFNYLGQFDQDNHGEPAKISPINTGKNISAEMEQSHALDINGIVIEGKLSFSFAFSKHEYKQDNIERLVRCFRSCLANIVHHCKGKEEKELTSSDIGYTGLDIDELEKYQEEFADFD